MRLQLPRICVLSLLTLAGAAAADTAVDSRQILLPVGDVSADPGWSLYNGDEGYARALQDLSADLSRQDGLESAAFAAAGSNGEALTLRLKSGAPPQGTRSGDHIMHVWARAATPNGATYRVALPQGDETLWLSGVQNAPAGFQEATMTVPQSAALAITDYQELRLRFYAQGRPFFLTKAYMEASEDQAPDLGYADTALWGEPVNVLQYELDPLVTGVSWVEDRGVGSGGDLYAFCSGVNPQTGRPRRVGDARGVSMGRTTIEATPQAGRTGRGSFAVMLDREGYIVTCDIDETDPAQSVVKRWAGPDLDPAEDDPESRHYRASIFATKDYTQPDRIVVYQYRDPADDGAYELYLVDLDRDPLSHVRIWNPPPYPAGALDGLVLSTQRTLDATPYWFWGCFRSTAPGSRSESAASTCANCRTS